MNGSQLDWIGPRNFFGFLIDSNRAGISKRANLSPGGLTTTMGRTIFFVVRSWGRQGSRYFLSRRYSDYRGREEREPSVETACKGECFV